MTNSHTPTPPPAAAPSATLSLGGARFDDVFYPCSDGKRMFHDMWHGGAIVEAYGDLMSVHHDALVAVAILVYPERGNNRNRISPDILVGLGLGMHLRSSYFVWEEGKPPDWVLEVASPCKEADDRGYNRDYYAEMGVPEYWLFDPKGDVYPPGTPRLQGLQLVDGAYRPLPSRLVDGEQLIRSEMLGLDVSVDGRLLRFRYPEVAKIVRHRHELEADIERDRAAAEMERAATRRAEVQTRQEIARRKAAETRIAELKAARRRLSAGHPP